MFGLQHLTAALHALTGNVLALAATVGEVNAGLRSRLALDGDGEPLPALPPALEARAALPGPPADPAALTDPDPSANGKGRRRAKAE